MQLILLLGLGLLPAIFSESITTTFKHIQQDKICGISQLTNLEGMISSPNYPSVYPNHTSCTWIIISPAQSKLMISVTDFDVEEDTNCNHPPCCQHTWLSLPKGGGRRGSQQYCGSRTVVPSIVVTQNVTFIKFHTSKVVKGGRGFQLKYNIAKVYSNKMAGIPCAEQCSNGLICVNVNGVFLCETAPNVAQKCDAHNMVTCGSPDWSCFDNVTQRCDGIQDCLSGMDEANCGSRNCYSDELMCHSGNGCYKLHQKCDMKMDCSDFSDEMNCGLCADGLVLCSPVDRRCFSPNLERCNGKLDCLFGEDEVGCAKGCQEDEVACVDGGGCYTPPHRCDSVRHCRDGSDEAGCPPCAGTRFPCDNGRCVTGTLRCNGQDDCGDDSDERGCLPTSVITLAIIGSLAGGLTLVLAAGFARRLYGDRNPAPLLVPPPPDVGFFHREPPPAYTPEDRPRHVSRGPRRSGVRSPPGLHETSLEGAGGKPPRGAGPSSTVGSGLSSQESATSSTSLASCQLDNDDTELLIL